MYVLYVDMSTMKQQKASGMNLLGTLSVPNVAAAKTNTKFCKQKYYVAKPHCIFATYQH